MVASRLNAPTRGGLAAVACLLCTDREMQAMDHLANIKACKERFLFVEVIKDLYDRDGCRPRFAGGSRGGGGIAGM